jgi:uptake hydrogenase large subunit
MSFSGIVLGLEHDGTIITRIRTLQARPLLAERLFAGKTPEEAMRLAGVVFALCPMAQSFALSRALEALGLNIPGPDLEAVVGERVGSAIHHAALNLIPATHGTARFEDVRRARKAALAGDWLALADLANRVADELEACAQADVWSQPGPHGTRAVHHFLDSKNGVKLALNHKVSAQPRFQGNETRTSPQARTPFLNNLAASEALAWLRLDQGFANTPTRSDQPCEVGPHEAPTGQLPAGRLHALAVSLRRAAANLGSAEGRAELALQGASTCVDEGTACSVVMTSRGPFALTLRLDQGGRIQSATSVAPTEWNFHPEGSLADGIVGWPVTGAGLAHANRVIMSLDPCVEVRVMLIDNKTTA